MSDLQSGTVRFCLQGKMKTYLKRTEGAGFVGSFRSPFLETVGALFQAETGLSLKRDNFGRYWISIRTEHDFERIEAWCHRHEALVFIRSRMSLCVAMSMHQTLDNNSGAWQRTELGELEYRAKFGQDRGAMDVLLERLVEFRNRLPYYRDSEKTVVCAVPPLPDKKFDLPSWLAAALGQHQGLTDVTEGVRWRGEKRSLKELPLEQKWAALEAVDLDVSYDLSGSRVILIDDLYQSGITMHFVASRLLEAGAEHVFGLSIVKSVRNRDNQ